MIRVIQGCTGALDYSSYRHPSYEGKWQGPFLLHLLGREGPCEVRVLPRMQEGRVRIVPRAEGKLSEWNRLTKTIEGLRHPIFALQADMPIQRPRRASTQTRLGGQPKGYSSKDPFPGFHTSCGEVSPILPDDIIVVSIFFCIIPIYPLYPLWSLNTTPISSQTLFQAQGLRIKRRRVYGSRA